MIIDGTRFALIKRAGSETSGYTEEDIYYLGSPTLLGAIMNLKQLAREYAKDPRCAVDWLSDTAFIVWWADETGAFIIDESTERYIFRIERKDYTIEI